MNNYIDIMNKIRAAKDAEKAKEAALNAKLDAIITGATIKERYEARKLNKTALDEIGAELTAVNNEIAVLDLAIKICVEMHAKQAANRFIEACKAGKKGLIDTPTHYKKFKAAAAEALNEENAIINTNYYTVKVSFMYYSVIGHNDTTALYTAAENIITAQDAEKAKLYELTPAENIEAIARAAVQDAQTINEIYKKADEAAAAIKEKYSNVYAVTFEK